MILEPKLLEILRCPLTGQRFRLISEEDNSGRPENEPAGNGFLETIDGRIRYPVIGSMPMLTPGDAIEVYRTEM